MPDVYTSATFANHYEYKLRSISYPIRDDPTLGFCVTRYLEGSKATYAAPAFDTADAEFPTAYLSRVGSLEHVDGALVRYEVDYNSIPASRDDIEGFGARFPGFGTTTTANSAKTVLQALPASDRQTMELSVAAHGYTIGNVLGFFLIFGSGGRSFALNGHALILGLTTDTVTVNIALPVPIGTDAGFFTGTVRSFSAAFPARSGFTETVRTRVRYDYFLPGKTSGIASKLDIIVPSPLRITTADGAETETLSTTTQPTQANYESLVVGKYEFLAQASLDLWKGNILQRTLRYPIAR